MPRNVPKEYRRHEPEKAVLHQIVREHLNTFFELADARSGEGRGLPRYVKNAFRNYLACGILAHGFARLRCPDCGYDAVVAFSCKERICRYVVRPPFCQERLRRLDDGRVVYQLRNPWPDGSTHLVLEPVEFLGKLAALVPPPRSHLLRYHGVLAPNARRRRDVVPAETLPAEQRHGKPCEGRPWWSPGPSPRASFRGAWRGLRSESGSVSEPRWRQRMRRADLIRRTMGLDALECPRCRGHLEPIAEILEPGAVAKILRSMGLPDTPPLVAPARPPPLLDFDFGQEG